MGIQLNIKNAETRELAEDVARRMGVSLGDAVKASLKVQLRLLTKDERLERIRAITKGARDLWPKEMLEDEDHTAFLYDEMGLPK